MREDKNRVPPWLNFSDMQSPILIHCASGEFEYAKPLIREIRKKNPNQAIVVTYYSPTFESQIKNTEGVTFACPLPWDLPHVQREFFAKLRPKMVLISRTDLWPEFLYQAKTAKIPICVFSAVLSSHSSKITNPFLKMYYQWLYTFVSHVYSVSEEDKNNLGQLLSLQKITTIGDTRFDQVLYRISKPNHLKDSLLARRSERLNSVFIAGSTWPEDEREIIPIFKDLLRSTVQVIIAPHEPTEEHVEKLKKQITAMGIRPLLYSEATTWPPNQVLIIDQVGILADLYAWADWAFVGGSFKKQVHSVMEPLAQGCKTYFGPYYGNNREAILFSQVFNYATPVSSGAHMLKLILGNRNMDTSQTFRDGLKETVKSRAGASEKLAQIFTKPTFF